MALAVLRLRITGSPSAYTVSAEVGGDTDTDTLGPLPDKLRENLERLQEAMLLTTESLRNRAVVRERPVTNEGRVTRAMPMKGFNLGEGYADIKGIQEIGSRLFDCVFQPAVYKLYKDSLDAAVLKREELHIKLCVEAPELSYVPWETMYDKRGGFHLSRYQWTPFARAATMKERDLYIYDELPLRVLCMISAPKDFIGTNFELRTDDEHTALEQEISRRTSDAKLCWTASGTRRELKKRIVKGDNGEKWDVFLFIGHGREGQLVFEEDGGTGYQLISADDLRGLLDGANGPKLVILNSCKGASKPEDRFASTAETLVKDGGIAAVVAMQFDISDTMGTQFTPAFFSNLLLNVPIQLAMTLTRQDLQSAGFSEWISPVLYMQNKDGTVVPPPRAPVAGGAS